MKRTLEEKRARLSKLIPIAYAKPHAHMNVKYFSDGRVTVGVMIGPNLYEKAISDVNEEAAIDSFLSKVEALAAARSEDLKLSLIAWQESIREAEKRCEEAVRFQHGEIDRIRKEMYCLARLMD